MDLRLYVVHGSHPCAAVEKAMSMKGLPYRVTEWPPPLHAPIQRALFGARTVPALQLDGGREGLGLAGDHAPARAVCPRAASVTG
jgi:glutathione S-transferase